MKSLLGTNGWSVVLLGAALSITSVGCSDGSPAKGNADGGKDGGDDSGTSGGGGGGSSSGDSGKDGGGSGDDGGSSGGSSSGGSSSGGSSSGGSSGGSGGCATDCDDGIDCTADECVDGTCVHSIDASVCKDGESCDLQGGGCTAGSACGDTSDCDFPQCSQNRNCDPALAACVYDALDGDGDGFSPSICGGGDCNDASGRVHPGATERCNGEDDDCDGKADNGAQCAGEGQVCVEAGTDTAHCACPDSTTECSGLGGTVCADTKTNLDHCGGCNQPCGSAGTCTDGACSCSDPGTQCTVNLGPTVGVVQLCVDTQTDASHCGKCNDPCGSVYAGGLCEGGGCVECGTEGLRCCGDLGASGTGCSFWLRCNGNPGGKSSKCEPCGENAGDPCCDPPYGDTPVCSGDWQGPGHVPGGPVCGDNNTCVNP